MQAVPAGNGLILPDSNNTLTLLSYAEAHLSLGRSVIPLLGNLDPSRPKAPAIPWAEFQHRRAFVHEHEKWGRKGIFGGLGIVTGRISSLIVLDFDSEEVFNDFRVQYSHLTETHTVRSAGRQLPHLYFKLPPYLNLPSQKGNGVDLLSDGRYVVTPPTIINGQSYKLIRGGMPIALSEQDIRRLQTFLNRHTQRKTLPSNITTLIPPKALETPISPAIKKTAPSRKLSAKDLCSMYSYYCQQGGRNDALFRTSLFARDTGWHSSEALNVLVPLHIKTAQRNETPAQRQREALRTISSAFSRPARAIKSQAVRQQGLLCNSVREKLIQQGKTYVVRTLEGLLHNGKHPGEVITSKEAVARLKGIVGRDSVLKALKAVEGNEKLFPPPDTPHYVVATENAPIHSINAFIEGGKNQCKPQGGRPAHLYTIPTNEDLCRILGVEDHGSDPLEQDDLITAQKTRLALHRELLKRRPGEYPRQWLANRLGVSRRTIAAYKQLIPVHSRVMFADTPISWKTIECLPFEEPISGAFLVDTQGKKYPAMRSIASRLLARGEGLVLKQQLPNFYWYGDDQPPIPQMHIREEQVQKPEAREAIFVPKQKAAPSELLCKELKPSQKPVKIAQKLPKNFYKPLINVQQEALAQHLYASINQMGEQGRKIISLANARRIALQSEKQVRNALNIIHQRRSVANPVGFLLTILRSSNQ